MQEKDAGKRKKVFKMNNLTRKAGNITVKGIIIPAKWDTKGNVVAIAISTHGEEEYSICNDSLGRTLFRLLHELVQVTGQFKDADGVKCIEVEGIEKCPVIMDDAVKSSRSEKSSS